MILTKSGSACGICEKLPGGYLVSLVGRILEEIG